MSALSAAAHRFWEVRSRRERILLALAAASLSVFVAWYGVALPLTRAAAAAETNHARAAQQWLQVEQSAATRLPLAGFERILQSAKTAGVALDRHRIENTREMTIWCDVVEPGAFFTWIETLQNGHGVVVTNMTAARNDNGRLRVEAVVARAGL